MENTSFGAFITAGVLDGLLGVAGFIMKITMKGISNPHSLRKQHQ